MGLKENIDKIKEYFISFNVDSNENAALLLVKFPTSWKIPDGDSLLKEFKVQTAPSPEGVYFGTEIENGTDPVFEAVEFVIKFNKEAEERRKLLEQKFAELSELFATEPIEKLRSLIFIFGQSGEIQKSKKEEKKKAAAPEKAEEAKETKEIISPIKEEPKKEDSTPKKDKKEASSLLNFAKTLTK